MADQLLAGRAWSDSVVVGLQFRRHAELYDDLNASTASCAAPRLGDARSLDGLPLILCGVRSPSGLEQRCAATIDRSTAPAIVSFTVPREIIRAAHAAGDSHLTLTLAVADTAGHEVPIIEAGTLYLLGGGL